MNRNLLYAIIGALVAIVALLAYQSYDAQQSQTGVQINLDDNGISITTKK
jgi:ribose/xylose/arabinose/galactoside ABC-type transport system permease subunit